MKQVSCDGLYGAYVWTDEAHIEEAKAVLLDRLIDTIRELAKRDDFWIVHQYGGGPVALIGCPPEIPSNVAASVAWKIHFPQMEKRSKKLTKERK